MDIAGPFHTISVCALGERIELAPHLDRWMMGDRYGVVVGFARLWAYTSGRRYVRCKPEFASVLRVKLDVSGKIISVKADGIGKLVKM